MPSSLLQDDGSFGPMAKRTRADVKHAIDLLWTHQIRRENASLHKQIQQIQNNISHDTRAQEELRAVAQNAQRTAAEALSAIEPVWSDLIALQARCTQTEAMLKGTSDQFGDLMQRINACEQTWLSNTSDINDRINRNEIALREVHDEYEEHVAAVQVRYDEISSKLQSKLGQDSLEGLHLSINAIERQLAELVQCQDSLSRVEDSIELITTVKGRNLDGLNNGPRCDPRRADEESGDGEEQMLTLRSATRRESTTDGSFDLDGNVVISSYAGHAYQASPPPNDSLRPIAEETEHIEPTMTEIGRLKQGRYHSWDRYLAEGQSLMDKIPRGQELLLVQNFVDGLYANGEREQCREWLKLSGWSWSKVAAFPLSGTPSAAARSGAPRTNWREVSIELPQTRSQCKPTHEHQTVPANKAEISNSFPKPNPYSSLPHQKEPTTSLAPRRSARIAQSQTRTRSCKPLLVQNQQREAKPEEPDSRERSNSSDALGVDKRPLLARPMPTASGMRQTGSRPDSSRERLRNPETLPRGGQANSQTPLGQSLRPAFPKTPKHDPSSNRVGDRGSLLHTGSRKRAGQFEWSRTDSGEDAAATSDEVQLPTIPSPPVDRRKKRKITSTSGRRTMLPPPDIPILPTSE